MDAGCITKIIVTAVHVNGCGNDSEAGGHLDNGRPASREECRSAVDETKMAKGALTRRDGMDHHHQHDVCRATWSDEHEEVLRHFYFPFSF
jgi:hypothetical protein